jgi:hypothetical protein
MVAPRDFKARPESRRLRRQRSQLMVIGAVRDVPRHTIRRIWGKCRIRRHGLRGYSEYSKHLVRIAPCMEQLGEVVPAPFVSERRNLSVATSKSTLPASILHTHVAVFDEPKIQALECQCCAAIGPSVTTMPLADNHHNDANLQMAPAPHCTHFFCYGKMSPIMSKK